MVMGQMKAGSLASRGAGNSEAMGRLNTLAATASGGIVRSSTRTRCTCSCTAAITNWGVATPARITALVSVA